MPDTTAETSLLRLPSNKANSSREQSSQNEFDTINDIVCIMMTDCELMCSGNDNKKSTLGYLLQYSHVAWYGMVIFY